MQNVKIEPFEIIGIAVRTTNENEQAAVDITALWNRLMVNNLVDQIPNKVDSTIYSLYTDYESDHTRPYTTILGCKVKNLSNVPDGMVGRSFKGGNYVKISAKGDLSKGLVAREWYKIWELDFKRVFSVDFEVYGEKAQNPTDAEVDFLIAIEYAQSDNERT